MATRSTIAVQHADGTVSQVYCHWDGHIKGNGEILNENYTTLEAVEELISFGDMSSLGKRAVPKGKHSYRKPEPGVTVYYGRDSGDSHTSPRRFSSLEEYVAEYANFCEEYDYLFIRDGVWYVRDHGDVAQLLSEAIDEVNSL